MAIECAHCGAASTEVFFRKPETRPKSVRWLRLALLVAACLSISTMWSLVDTMQPWADVATDLEARVAQSTAVEEAGSRDLYRITAGLINILFVGASVALVVALFRYIALLRKGFTKGDPIMLARIRQLAWLQIWMQVASFTVVVAVFGELETLTVTPGIGAGIITGPILLYIARRPDIRAFFSEFTVKPAAPPAWREVPAAAPRMDWQQV